MFYRIETISSSMDYGDAYHYYATLADALDADMGTPEPCDVIESHPTYGDDWTFVHIDGVIHTCEFPPDYDVTGLFI